GVDRETLRTKRGSPTRRRDARAGSATEMPRPEPHDNMGIRDPVAVPAGGVPGVPGPGAVTVRTPAPRRDVPGPPGGRRVEIHVRNAVCLDGFGARRDPDPPAIGQVDPLARGIVLDVGDGVAGCRWWRRRGWRGGTGWGGGRLRWGGRSGRRRGRWGLRGGGGVRLRQGGRLRRRDRRRRRWEGRRLVARVASATARHDPDEKKPSNVRPTAHGAQSKHLRPRAEGSFRPVRRRAGTAGRIASAPAR